MIPRVIFWPLTVILGFGCELLAQDFFSIFGFSPRLLLLATLFFAVKEGPLVGECLGFGWGLLADMGGLCVFGSHTFMLTALGYLGGVLRGKIDETILLAQVSLVWGISLLYIVGLSILEASFGGEPRRFLAWNSLWDPIIAGILSPILFYFFNRWLKMAKISQ